MSLSFVSKAIQTTNEDGAFEETEIVGGSTTGIGDGSSSKPLFEQLRSNQEVAEAEREEQQIAMMRGTLALDEEDAAHLASLERMKKVEQTRKQQQTQLELERFRAAQAERLERQQDDLNPTVSADRNIKQDFKILESKESSKKLEFAPIIKRKRRRTNDDDNGKHNEPCDKGGLDQKEMENTTSKTEDIYPDSAQNQKHGREANELTTLLTGYGSSSDED